MPIKTYPKWLIAKNIRCLKIKEDFSLTDVAKVLGMSSNNPYFREVINELLSIGAIKLKTVGNVKKLIEKNDKILENYIQDNDIYKEFSDYVHKTKLIYADI